MLAQPTILPQQNLSASLITTNQAIGAQQENSLVIAPGVIKRASLKLSIFTIMAAAIGTGVFNLPQRASEVGLIMLTVYISMAGLFSYLGYYFLVSLISAKGYGSYSEMTQSIGGLFLKRLSQVCVIIYAWGIGICFQVIISKFCVELLADVFHMDLYEDRAKQIYNDEGNRLRIYINIGVICTNFVFIQLKNLSILQKFSMIGVVSAIYNSVLILVVFFTGFRLQKDNDTYYHGLTGLDWKSVTWVNFHEKSFSSYSNHAQCLASIIFCYINHHLVFPVCKNLSNPTIKRRHTCFILSTLNTTFIYLIIGFAGYLLLVEHEKKFPFAPIVLANIDIKPMIVGKCLLIANLYIGIPLNLYPAKITLQETFKLKKNNQNHYLLCIFLAFTSSLIAILFVEVNSYFGLMGGTAGVLIGGGIPSFCYWKVLMKNNKKERNYGSYLLIGFCIVVTLISFGGAILSVIDQF